MNKDFHTSQSPMGYVRVQARHGLKSPPHFVESFAVNGGRRTHYNPNGTREYYPRPYWPGDSDLEHLEFALKYEGLNLGVLRGVMPKISASDLQKFIAARPTSQFRRKLWYLFESFTGKSLALRDVRVGNYVDLLDPNDYYAGPGRKSGRHRVSDNLPGDLQFSPIVRRTPELAKFEAELLEDKTRRFIATIPEDILQRAIDYLFIKETKSSYAIERETPDHKRARRFITALRSATSSDFLSKEALIELQKMIVDPRFADNGWRKDQVYIGTTLARGNQEIHFIAAKPQELAGLMENYFAASRRIVQSEIHPVVAAALIAFPFVFLHPFSDGNGRVHRFLIHFVLAQRRFAPEGVIFPISAAMLNRMTEYDCSLETFSKPLMELAEYDIDARGRLTVLNETTDLYRYIDCTQIAETLFRFVKETIEKELPAEVKYLEQYDSARSRMRAIVDLPNRHADLFIKFCQQNKGVLGKDRRKMPEFQSLTDAEIKELQTAVRQAFAPAPNS